MEDWWIKIFPKRLLEWEWYDDANMFRMFMHLLLKANNKEKQWHGTAIKRGQLVTSIATLSLETGLSPKSVRTCLDKLVSTGEIGKQTANNCTIITVCKYCSYQANKETEGQANGKASANEGQGIGKASATTVEYKNNRLKEDKKKISTKVDIKEKEKTAGFIEPEFAEAFEMWLEYKSQRRETYKSELSLKVCYNKLVRLSGGDPTTAKAIIEQSMANNWAGIFPLKDDNANGTDTLRQAPVAGRLPGQTEGKNPLAGYDKIIHA